MTCPDTPLPLAQFQTMAAATMGVDAAWDRAIASYLAADIRMRAQESYGPLARQKDADAVEAHAMAKRLGVGWRDTPEGAEVAAQHSRNLVAKEDRMRAEFYEPQWQSLRDVVRTPAPSFAAAAWKAALIEWEDVWCDSLLEADCVAILDADLARLTGGEQ